MREDQPSSSPQWPQSTKVLVTALILVLIAALIIRFNSIMGTLVVSLLVYVLITPLVSMIVRRARLSWIAATNISFLFLLLIMIVVFTALGLAVAQQFQSLFNVTKSFFTELPQQVETIFEHGLVIGPWNLDFSGFDTVTLFEQATRYIDLVFSSASTVVLSVSSVALETVVGSLIVLVISYFLTLDDERFRSAWTGFIIPGYEYDFNRLRGALARMWSSFLGGQLLVVFTTGLLTWIGMSALGMRFSLGIGVLGGLARFVPIVGPWVAGIVAIVVALVQPSNWFALTPGAHAAIVALFILVLNQSIDYYVIPRIMGNSLNISPAIVLIATLLGAILAGVLGLLLAAPVVASLALLGRYVLRKMLDQSPWDPPIDAVPEARDPFLVRLMRRVRRGSEEGEVQGEG